MKAEVTSLDTNGVFHVNGEVGISEFLVKNLNWNTPRSQISDSESGENLTNPDLNIQYGCSLHQHTCSCLLALLSYLCLIAHSRPTVQFLSVDMLLQCLYVQNTA